MDILIALCIMGVQADTWRGQDLCHSGHYCKHLVNVILLYSSCQASEIKHHFQIKHNLNMPIQYNSCTTFHFNQFFFVVNKDTQKFIVHAIMKRK